MSQFYIVPKPDMDNIEAAIQQKRGESRPYAPEDMAAAISTIPSSVDGTDVPVGGIYLTKPDTNGNPTELHVIGIKLETAGSCPIYNNGSKTNLRKIEYINCEKMTDVGAQAFAGYTNLATVTLPEGLLAINNMAFSGCSSLISIYVPRGTTTMGTQAFSGDTLLESVFLPNSLTAISSSAFIGCTKLTNVILETGFNCSSFVLSYSTRYSVETIVSWLEALADRTGQPAYTLTMGATNLNKLTAEQIAIATAKNWTLA